MKAILNSLAIKEGEYYRAAVKVFMDHSPRFNLYKSTEMFVTRKVALKHAAQWAKESREVGYVTCK